MIGSYFASTKNYAVRSLIQSSGSVVFWMYEQLPSAISPSFLHTHHVVSKRFPAWMPGSIEKAAAKAKRDMNNLQARLDAGANRSVADRVHRLRDSYGDVE